MATNDSNAPDVFISYSHHNKKIADIICTRLEQNRFRCWYAPRDIKAGEDWAESIIAAIERVKVMVILFTDESNASIQVRNEIANAVKAGTVVVPFKLTRQEPSKGLQYYLTAVHWLDAVSVPLDQGISALISLVDTIVHVGESRNGSGKEQSDSDKQITKEQGWLDEESGPEYECPYCGKKITKKNVLFWETVRTQYTDDVRGGFLRRHGVKVSAGNRFPRVYYKVRNIENVIREDENGFPTMIEDSTANAILPAFLGPVDIGEEEELNIYDMEFDSGDLRGGMLNRTDRRNQVIHNIPQRACPHCHCELPPMLGVIPVHHVSLFGGRASGKTAYLINLFQQAEMQMSENNLGTVRLENESGAYLWPMIEDYEREGTTRPTPADGGLLPIICHYKNIPDEALIVFHDIAGEGTDQRQYMANLSELAKCETLMLMIDPNMLVGGAFFTAWNANHLAGYDRYSLDGDCCREPLDSYLQGACTMYREYSGKLKQVICVITKLDMLLEADFERYNLNNLEIMEDIGNSHRDALNLRVLRQVNDEISSLLKNQFGVSLKSKLQTIFGAEVKISILGVSTSTLAKSNEKEIVFEPRSSSVDRKHRIIEPFLAVLMYHGLIPVKNDDGEMGRYGEVPEITEQTTANIQTEKAAKKHGIFGWRKQK